MHSIFLLIDDYITVLDKVRGASDLFFVAIFVRATNKDFFSRNRHLEKKLYQAVTLAVPQKESTVVAHRVGLQPMVCDVHWLPFCLSMGIPNPLFLYALDKENHAHCRAINICVVVLDLVKT